ncbi:MAG: PEP-CTERM sorting domain-containing protein [Opitutae bacterium]|nr:PEP-CTERM sorting domain-containing protein [Opitutae bacterium]
MKDTFDAFLSVFTTRAPRGLLAALALAALSVSASAQTQITITQSDTTISWTNVGGSGSPSPEGGRPEARMVDGSGVTTDTYYVHAVGDNNIASNLTQQTGGLLIDLGASYQVGTMQIWAFNDAGVFGNLSPTSFDFYYSTDSSAITTGSGQIQVADLAKFTQLTNNTALAEASHAAGYVGETYTFGAGTTPSYLSDYSGGAQSLSGSAITARYIFLNDLTGSTAFGGRMGLSEIQVYTYAAVPEPSTYAAIFGALALGAVGVIRRRRTVAAKA